MKRLNIIGNHLTVDGIDLGREFLIDVRPSDLHRCCHFVIVVVEFFGQEFEAADILNSGKLLVGFLNFSLDQGKNLRQTGKIFEISESDTFVDGPFADIVKINLQQSRHLIVGRSPHSNPDLRILKDQSKDSHRNHGHDKTPEKIGTNNQIADNDWSAREKGGKTVII